MLGFGSLPQSSALRWATRTPTFALLQITRRRNLRTCGARCPLTWRLIARTRLRVEAKPENQGGPLGSPFSFSEPDVPSKSLRSRTARIRRTPARSKRRTAGQSVRTIGSSFTACDLGEGIRKALRRVLLQRFRELQVDVRRDADRAVT